MAKKNKKRVLGRGLSALLDDPDREIQSISDSGSDKVVGNIINLEVNKIGVNPYQPRTNFNEEAIMELAESIRSLGIIQPVTVRKLSRNQYQLVSGERRLRAAKYLKLETLPAFVRIANDQETLEMALVENIQRRDLDPIEIALSYQRLIDDIQLTQNQLSQRVGKKRSTVANYMRLLKLDPIIQTGIRDGFLSMGHGRALINIEDSDQQLEIYEKVISKSLSVRATELLVNNLKKVKTNKSPQSYQAEIFKQATEQLRGYIGTAITIKGNEKGKGNINVPFDSYKTLQKILKKIMRED
ncbi:MAG: chromosome partitioning protein ParB [Flavobacteriaceae bacterium]|nr:chromosome partitioning protein ParB [Flavobacteriaceae bacterium]|tara:strand:- start:1789 stop:2685 length:897 start_codon:yes stop_codon:yes gene_type:complete